MENEDKLLAKQIGYRIRIYRKKAFLTQTELANRLGLAKSAIANYETGVSIPKDTIKPKICEILGVSLDTLFGTKKLEKNTKTDKYNWNDNLLAIPILGKISARFCNICRRKHQWLYSY